MCNRTNFVALRGLRKHMTHCKGRANTSSANAKMSVSAVAKVEAAAAAADIAVTGEEVVAPAVRPTTTEPAAPKARPALIGKPPSKQGVELRCELCGKDSFVALKGFKQHVRFCKGIKTASVADRPTAGRADTGGELRAPSPSNSDQVLLVAPAIGLQQRAGDTAVLKASLGSTDLGFDGMLMPDQQPASGALLVVPIKEVEESSTPNGGMPEADEATGAAPAMSARAPPAAADRPSAKRRRVDGGTAHAPPTGASPQPDVKFGLWSFGCEMTDRGAAGIVDADTRDAEGV
jgi:hypothetical protein